MELRNGLTNKEVEERIQKGQVNYTGQSISKTKEEIIKEHTLTYFNFLNIFLAILIIISGQFQNLTFIGVMIANTVLGIIQELKVKKTIDQLSVVTVENVKTIRDGNLIDIPVEQLVLDDIIYLQAGDQVGTDCRIIENHALEMNESLLTGESKPVNKKEDDEVFAGTFVVAGSAYLKVIRVGNDNYSTDLVNQAKHKHLAASEMRDSIEKIIKIMSIIIIPVGILLFRAQYKAMPDDFNTALVKTVGGVIGMIPEGLVLLTSLSFVLGVGRLAKKRALVQQMESIESLSRVDVLCLDKTGTITTGELKVKHIVPIDDRYDEEKINDIMGSFAHLVDDINPTQKALMEHFKNNNKYQKISEIPFSSERKYRAITFDDHRSFVLGAPEFLTNDQEILEEVSGYSQFGLRVLMLGEADYIEEGRYHKLTPVCLITISDIIKDDAHETFDYFKSQGVSIKVLSGDNPLTVSRVCTLAGLEGASQYMDASTLPDTVEEMRKVIGDTCVFGRVKPEQKQLIIKAFQENGHVVGMVGDGVNDVLAIKDADCGIAMANGADAAKQAAHIVLLDSNFGSMKEIVEEGRVIIANIEKVSSLYLTKTIYSTILSLIFGCFCMTYPFTPFQLSLISGMAIGLPSFIITLEHNTTINSKGFLTHVIHTALPCALTVVIMVLFNFLLKWMFFLNAKYFSTYSFLITIFVSFIVLYKVSKPLNLVRKFNMILNIILTVGCLYAIPKYFYMYPITDLRVIIIITFECVAAVYIVTFITKGLDHISEYIEWKKGKHA